MAQKNKVITEVVLDTSKAQVELEAFETKAVETIQKISDEFTNLSNSMQNVNNFSLSGFISDVGGTVNKIGEFVTQAVKKTKTLWKTTLKCGRLIIQS